MKDRERERERNSQHSAWRIAVCKEVGCEWRRSLWAPKSPLDSVTSYVCVCLVRLLLAFLTCACLYISSLLFHFSFALMATFSQHSSAVNASSVTQLKVQVIWKYLEFFGLFFYLFERIVFAVRWNPWSYIQSIISSIHPLLILHLYPIRVRWGAGSYPRGHWLRGKVTPWGGHPPITCQLSPTSGIETCR